MKREILAGALAALAVLTLVPGARAQRANSLEAGAWALEFSVEGQFISVSSLGGGLAVKRLSSPKSALRLNVGVYAVDQNRDITDGQRRTGDDSGTELNASALYQRYIDPDAEANFFWGIGPAVDYGHSSQTDVQADTLSYSYKNDRWGVGLDGLMGVEWFATRVISFHAEYIAGFRYSSTTSTRERTIGSVTDKDEQTSDGWSFAANGAARFGLSVYF